MKNFITTFLACLLFFIASAQKGGDGDAALNPAWHTFNGDCARIQIALPLNFDVLRADCFAQGPPLEIKFNYTLLDCDNLVEETLCDYEIEISIGGIILDTYMHGTDNGVSGIDNFLISLSTLQDLVNSGASELCIEVLISKNCTFSGESEIEKTSICVPIVNEEEIYCVETVSYDSEDVYCFDFVELIVCCDDDPLLVTPSSSVVEVTEEQTSTILTIADFTISGLGIEIPFPVQHVLENTTSVVNSDAFDISRPVIIKPEEGVCKNLGIKVRILEDKTTCYKAVECDGEDEFVSEVISNKRVIGVSLTECIMVGECDGLISLVGSNYRSSGAECTGDIIVDVNDTEVYSFNWIGPNGFTSKEKDLIQVPFGSYSLTYTDACCESITLQYFLCDDPVYGNWQANEDYTEFCRSLECGAKNCEVEGTVECVEPDEVIPSFENENCRDAYLYQGEVLGYSSIYEPVKEVFYNEATLNCNEIIYCNESEVENIIEPAEYTEWEFDVFLDKCVRMVICFGETIDFVDESMPTILEEFDDLTGLCTTKVTCEGEEIILPPLPPEIIGPWTWDEFNGCQQDVQCSIGSDVNIVYGDETFSNWSYDDTFEECVANNVYCNNEIVFGQTNSTTPNSFGAWDYNIDPFQCKRDVFCGITNELLTDYGEAMWVDLDQPCPSDPELDLGELYCDGLPTGITECVSSLLDPDSSARKNIKKENSTFILYTMQGQKVIGSKNLSTQMLQNIPSGMYIIAEYRAGKIITNKKIIINN